MKSPNMDPNLPTVQIPVGRKEAGLSIDGEFTPYWNLPEDARKAYDRFAEHKNRIYQCENCGYLTMSERTNKYKGYRCGNCGGRDFRMVYGGIVADDRIDPSDMDPDEYPNSEAHLTRIKNEAGRSISQSEMLYRVAKAVKRHREPLRRAVDEATERGGGRSKPSQKKLESFVVRGE